MAIKLKAIGLALLTAFVLSAVAASAASAQTIHSTSTSGTTHLTFDQHEKLIFDTPAGTIQCNTITGHATFSGTTATVVTATGLGFDTCTAFGLEAHIDTMGCDLKVTGTNATTASGQLECPTTAGGVTDEVTLTPTQGGASICHVNFPEQSANVKVFNTAGTAALPGDIDIEAESTTLKYSVVRTAGGAKCPTEGVHTDGNLTKKITVTGFQNAAHTERVSLTYT